MYTNHAVTGTLIELIGKPISLAPIYRAVTASKWVFLLVEDMIKRKDITGRFDNSKMKTNFDDWCSLSVASDVSGGEFAAISFDHKTHFHVGVELSAVTYISENDKSNTDRVEDLLRNKIMSHIYGDILNDIHDIRMNIDFEGRQASLEAVDRLLKKLATEIYGG